MSEKDCTNLKDVPFDDGPSWIFQNLLPMLETGFVLLGLIPAKLDLADGITTADQIVVANLKPERIQNFSTML